MTIIMTKPIMVKIICFDINSSQEESKNRSINIEKIKIKNMKMLNNIDKIKFFLLYAHNNITGIVQKII